MEEIARTKALGQKHAWPGLREGQTDLGGWTDTAPLLLASSHLVQSEGLISNGLKKKDLLVPTGKAKGLPKEPMSREVGDREGKGV